MARRKKAQTRRPRQQTPVQVLSEVRQLLKAKDYEAADTLITRHGTGLPHTAEVCFLRGRINWSMGRLVQAEGDLSEAIALNPQQSSYYNDRGLAKRSQYRYFDACADFLQAIRLDPKGREALNNLATNYIDIGDSDGAVMCLSAVMERTPDYALGHSNLLFTMNYLEDRSQADLFEAARGFAERFENTDRKPAYTSRSVPADPSRRLRLGFISGDMRDHPVAQFFLPLIENLDHAQVEVICYSSLPAVKADAVTDKIKMACDAWNDVDIWSDDELVRRIVRDRIDVLVDMSGHTSGNRLTALARRPAPVQATWLGYPNTTGLRAIDYRLTDDIVEPGFGTFTTETPVPLEGGFHCYRPTEGAPAVGPLPARKNGYITFGSMNNLAKVTPSCLRMWAAILREVPGAHLKFKARGLADNAVAERIRQIFENEDIALERLEFLPFQVDKADHLALFQEIDIALDSAPYTGTTTTCDSLWMGVPVITMTGQTPAARVSASLMHRVGLEPLVAADAESYVKHAVELASDVDRLADLRAAIRSAFESSPLRDEAGFAAKFERFVRTAWTQWCDGSDATHEADEDVRETPAPARPRARSQAPVQTKAGPPAAVPDEVRVLHHLARTGGTLISKCLGSMEGIVLLSEAHPKGLRHIDAIKQAQDWFGLIDAEEVAEIRASAEPFAALIRTAAARCAERGQHLVVRDWTHLDFTGMPFVKRPSYRLTTADFLGRHFATVTKTATVRHPVDEWLSLNRLKIVNGRLSVRDYLRGYRRFAEAAAEIGFLRYEDFTADPDAQLALLCDRLNLPFDPGYSQRWAGYRTITGDTAGDDNTATTIRASQPKTYPAELLASFETCADYHKAIDLLGYRPAARSATARPEAVAAS